jgi:hypothetical protein
VGNGFCPQISFTSISIALWRTILFVSATFDITHTYPKASEFELIDIPGIFIILTEPE